MMYLLIFFQKCVDQKVSNKLRYPTFSRTSPTATKVSKSIISLLLSFNWNKFSFVIGSDKPWNFVADEVTKLAEGHNMTINSYHTFKGSYANVYFPPSNDNELSEIIDESFKGTRSKYLTIYGTLDYCR